MSAVDDIVGSFYVLLLREFNLVGRSLAELLLDKEKRNMTPEYQPEEPKLCLGTLIRIKASEEIEIC